MSVAIICRISSRSVAESFWGAATDGTMDDPRRAPLGVGIFGNWWGVTLLCCSMSFVEERLVEGGGGDGEKAPAVLAGEHLDWEGGLGG